MVPCRECKTVLQRRNIQSYRCGFCRNVFSAPHNWGSIRKRILKERGFCEYCERTKNLHIDHIDKNRRNNDESNLRVLCNQCHLSMHGNEGKKLIDIDYQLHGVRLHWA